MNKKLLKALVIGIVLAVVFSSFAGCNSKKKSDSEKSKTTESSAQKSSEKKDTNEFYSSDEELFDIKTDYAVLKYPSEFKETVRTSVTTKEPYTVAFTTDMNNTEIKLFDIIFGGNDGYKLGTLKKDGKSVDVYTKDYSAEYPTSLSDEETGKLDVMTQKINIIISNLIKDYDFEVSD